MGFPSLGCSEEDGHPAEVPTQASYKLVILAGEGVKGREISESRAGAHESPQSQAWEPQLTSDCLLFSTDSREVKVGEYNAVADTLEIINDTIRFQGKACGLPDGHPTWEMLRAFGFVGSNSWSEPVVSES
jgi:hypothetical protein